MKRSRFLSLSRSPLLLLHLLLRRRVGASVSAFAAEAPGGALHVEEEGRVAVLSGKNEEKITDFASGIFLFSFSLSPFLSLPFSLSLSFL